jgi:hypothetical protein
MRLEIGSVRGRLYRPAMLSIRPIRRLKKGLKAGPRRRVDALVVVRENMKRRVLPIGPNSWESVIKGK